LSTPSPLTFLTLTTLKVSVDQNLRQARAFSHSLPPSGLVLLSSFAVQLGTAVSKSLFEALGASGAAFQCKWLAAILLLIVWRPRLRNYCWQDYLVVGLFGLSIALMHLAVYAAIERIPLGVASTLEFIGPLGVAIAGSRRALDLVWVALAAIGVVLLAPLSGDAALDPVGVGFALISGLGWASYILLSTCVGQVMPGGAGLALAIAAASILTAPFGLGNGAVLLKPELLILGLLAAVLTTVLPYSLEFSALKRISPRNFGVLMSVEPAIAALVGFVFLHERLSLQTLLATALVTMAAIGTTLWGRASSHP
jgi:inner membrane transporter RhtA